MNDPIPAYSALPGNIFVGAYEYMVDTVQRSILFWDVLHQRGNNYLKHRRRGQPPVLQFPHEMILDGRKLERPVNYALLRIKPEPGTATDPTMRPYVVIDPRAGHGPGIGGFKQESQVGVALAAGHPVYFVSFFPEPEPGQRLIDVANAEAIFIEEVARRHPHAQGKPCVIGNCQAGWAVAGLAAMRPEIMGPVILSGAPLSYWSGASGRNPMRYAGGLIGGKWMETLACDVGNGLFDGAHLVSNFENLDLANTFWNKYYNLYSKVDTEAPRFLEFETWWSGFFLMNREEIDAIVSDLFVGNKLTRQQITTPEGKPLDLRNIRSPIVVFASWGDNITPPQQALNWIEDVYGDEQQIIDNDQVIIYLLHKDVGHLGIFVSGRVAAREHKELVGTMEMIDALPPGLYEMIIESKDAAAKRTELEPGQYLVRFESRKMEDIRAISSTREEETLFQTVDSVSRLNDRLYKTFVSPWVRAFTTRQSAELTRRLHPLRLQRELLSDDNPLLRPLPMLAQAMRRHRYPVPDNNPFRIMEQMTSQTITTAWDILCDTRDTYNEAFFRLLYGPLGWGAIFPPVPWTQTPSQLPAPHEPAPLPDEAFERGNALTAVLRIVAGSVVNSGVFDRRSALIFRELKKQSRFKDVKSDEVHRIFKEQARLFRQDPNRAVDTLATLLPTMPERRLAIEVVKQILMLAPEDIHLERPLVKRLSQVLQLDLREVAPETELIPASTDAL